MNHHTKVASLSFDKNICFLLALLFLPLTQAWAQDNWKFRHLVSDDKALNKNVTTMCEDHYGYLWIGYDRGLDRFDGSSFTHYFVDPFDPGSLANPMVKCLHVDKKGRLWVGTQGGLFQFDYVSETFKLIDLDIESNQAIQIQRIGESFENGKSVLWLSYLFRGLIKYYPDTEESIFLQYDPKDDHSLSDSVFFDIVSFAESVWLGSYTQGILRSDDGSDNFTGYQNDKTVPNSIVDNHILGIVPDTISGDQVLWVGTGKSGLAMMNLRTEEFKHYPLSGSISEPPHPVRVLSLCQYNEIIISGTLGEGIMVLDPKYQKFYSFKAGSSMNDISGNIITSLFVSRDNILWVGSSDNGVCFHDPYFSNFSSIIHDINNPNSLSNNAINTINEVLPGQIWIGTNEGINILNEATNTITRHDKIPVVNELIPPGVILTIHKSKHEKDIIWITCFGEGLIRYDRKTGLGKQYLNEPANSASLSSNSIPSISEDKEGLLWLAGNMTGLNRMDPKTGLVTRYTYDPTDYTSLNDNSILNIYQDSDESTWITTYSGLAKYDNENDCFIRYYFDDGRDIPAANLCAEVLEDPHNPNILWICSAVGLLKFYKKSGEYSRFTIKDGLSANLVIGILPGTGSELWLSTSNGICSFDTKDNSVKTYNQDDGIQEMDFSFACNTITKSGCYYFGGNDGITSFYPNLINKTVVAKKPVLTKLFLFNEEVPVLSGTILDSSLLVKKKLTLRHSDYLFGIGFAATVFRKANDLAFEYILEGFSTDWVKASEGSKIATFTNIPHGSYTFKVRLAQNTVSDDDAHTSIEIKVLPPIWKTWWAKTFYVLAIAGLILGFTRWRTWRIKRENIRLEKIVVERTNELKLMNQHKDRFFSIVAHDLKSPFISLVKFTEIIVKRFQKLSDEERLDSIKEISKAQNNCYKYLTNLLDWSRVQIGRFEYDPRAFNLAELVNKKICFCKSQASQKEIILITEVDQAIIVFADYEMISVVFSNLLTNAIKFSKRGDQITISTALKGQEAFISVIDQGIGIEPELLERLFRIDIVSRTAGTEDEEGTGLGLILSKELIIKNRGNITVTSTLGLGSNFTFSIPLDSKIDKEPQI